MNAFRLFASVAFIAVSAHEGRLCQVERREAMSTTTKVTMALLVLASSKHHPDSTAYACKLAKKINHLK